MSRPRHVRLRSPLPEREGLGVGGSYNGRSAASLSLRGIVALS